MNNNITTFELPMYMEVSSHFEKFLKGLSNPLCKCTVTYFEQSGKLTFVDENGNKASIVPILSQFKERKKKNVRRLISSFCSKFNTSFSLRGKDFTVDVQLVTDLSSKDITNYDRQVVCLVHVTVKTKNLSKWMVLTNLFTLIDSSV